MANPGENHTLQTFAHAVTFAAQKHAGQCRKDGAPYINHPIALVHILSIEANINDVDVLCAALLHDTLEDTQTTIEEIVQAFGPHIASIVAAVTDDKRLPKAERKRLQIENAPCQTPQASLVKLADKIANLRDITVSPPPDWSLDRRREYFDWAKSVVHALPLVDSVLLALFAVAYSGKP